MLHWQYYMVFDTVQSIYSINIRVGECIEIGRRIHESVNAAPKRIQCVACVAVFVCFGGLGGFSGGRAWAKQYIAGIYSDDERKR